MILAPLPKLAFLDNNGRPLVGGKLFTYAAGTSTKLATYTDASGMSQNTNPIILDYRGECSVWMPVATAYKFILAHKDDTDPPTNPIWSVDNIASPMSQADFDLFLSLSPPFAQTDAETASGITAVVGPYQPFPYDIRRAGVVPNDAGAASANVTAARALFDPMKDGITGWVMFPNTTGSDIYYFNAPIPMRDGIRLDLMGSTINYTGTGTTADNNSGLFFTLRDFTCQNGSIVVDFDTGTASSAGYAIQIGARGADSSYFTVYDSLLPEPMGNIEIRNLRITSTVTGAGVAGSGAIQMIGGVQNVTFENLVIESTDSNLAFGIVSEFGWATNETAAANRQTSNLRNARFTNIIVRDLNATYGIAVDLAGAYSVSVDGLYVYGGGSAFYCTPGESLYYQPWVDQDDVGVKRAISLRNIVAQDLSATAITVQGAQSAAGGYYGWKALQAYSVGNIAFNGAGIYIVTVGGTSAGAGGPTGTGSGIVDGSVTWDYVSSAYAAETDLQDFTLDGFCLDCSGTPGGGWGILSSAGFSDIRNGTVLNAFERGILLTDEATKFNIENVNVFACTQTGIVIAAGFAIWSPARLSKGSIRNCYIAGNSTSSAGTFAGISIGANTDGVIIEGCRGGYETAYSGTTETAQGPLVNVVSGGAGAICRSNHVGGAVGGIAFANGATVNNGCKAHDNTGIIVNSGPWSDVQSSLNVITYSTSMTPSVAIDNEFTITANNGTAFTINAPTNATRVGQMITFTIRNTFGALGVATWNAIYKMQAWVQPGAGASRSIMFRYDGTSWVEIMRTSGDVTN